MNKREQSLVSIIVLTYNSGRYVFDTLESAKLQTYDNLELIVSDDCSEDQTVEIVRNWIDQNKERFESTVILESEKNTGISCNCNRALEVSRGEYIKYIAGDDLLKHDCIENNVTYIKSANIGIVFSRIELIDQHAKKPGEFAGMESDMNMHSAKFCSLPAKDQFKYLIFGSYVCSPTDFFRREFLKEMNGFDQDYFIEDYPLLLKISGRGYKLNFMPSVTVSYRLHSESMTNIGNKGFFNKKYIQTYPGIIRKYVGNVYFLKHPIIFLHYLLFSLARNLTILSGNKREFYRIYKLLFLLSPFYLGKKLKSIITKEPFLLYY